MKSHSLALMIFAEPISCQTVPMSAFTECGWLAVQVKHVIRYLSPDEYDEAVRQDPFSCPLVMTGDHRCGRQLLADAATDVHVQLAGMAAAIRGRMELDAVAAFVESAIAALDRRLDIEQQVAPMPPVS
jgi:hypothetical protein